MGNALNYKKINSGFYSTRSRTVLVEISNSHIAIVKNRKSRIIMKDGEKIINEASGIRKVSPDIKISLLTNAPVCSKTRKLLKENEIDIIEEAL